MSPQTTIPPGLRVEGCDEIDVTFELSPFPEYFMIVQSAPPFEIMNEEEQDVAAELHITADFSCLCGVYERRADAEAVAAVLMKRSPVRHQRMLRVVSSEDSGC